MNIETAKLIEITDIFVVLLTKNFHNQPDCIEETLYARNLKKPMIIIKSIDLKIPELFKKCNIFRIINELENPKKAEKLLKKSIKEWEFYHGKA